MKKSALLTFVCASFVVDQSAFAASSTATPVVGVTATSATSATPAAPMPQSAAVAAPAAKAQNPGSAANIPDQKAMLNLMQSFPVWRVYEPVAQEMLIPFALKPVTKASLTKLVDFQFSEKTQASFKEMFGNPDPLHINLIDNPDGGVDVNILLQALDYTDPQSQNHSRWDALRSSVSYSKDFKHFNSTSDWPYFSQSFGADANLELKQIRIVQEASYNPHHIALGKAAITIPEINFQARSAGSNVNAKNVLMTSDVSQQGNKLNMVLDMNAAEVQFSGHSIGPIHIDYHFLNLNEAPMAAFIKEAAELNKAEPSTEKKLAESRKLFTTKFLPILSPASRFEIRDLSVVYQSMKAALSAAVWLEKAKQSDMSDVKLLQQKIAAHVELTMPKALALKITKFIGTFQPSASLEQKANAGLQSMIARGMVKEEQDQLSVVVDFMNGAVKVNGHEMNKAAKK